MSVQLVASIFYFFGISKGFRRRMIAIGKIICFYCIQNVWKCTVRFLSICIQNLQNVLMWNQQIFGLKKVIGKKQCKFLIFFGFYTFLNCFRAFSILWNGSERNSEGFLSAEHREFRRKLPILLAACCLQTSILTRSWIFLVP